MSLRDWARLETWETDFDWEAAWEAALEAGAEPMARVAMARARRGGAGPRGAALAAAAVAAEALAGRLGHDQLRQLRAPLVGAQPAAPAGQRRRSGGWTRMLRCPIAAAAALVR